MIGPLHRWEGRFKSVDEIKAANEEIGASFFTAETLKFFKSRVSSILINGKYFVTSEDGGAGRGYTARIADSDGEIIAIGGFGAHNTHGRAFSYINRHIRMLKIFGERSDAYEIFVKNKVGDTGRTVAETDSRIIVHDSQVNNPDGIATWICGTLVYIDPVSFGKLVANQLFFDCRAVMVKPFAWL